MLRLEKQTGNITTVQYQPYGKPFCYSVPDKHFADQIHQDPVPLFFPLALSLQFTEKKNSPNPSFMLPVIMPFYQMYSKINSHKRPPK